VRAGEGGRRPAKRRMQAYLARQFGNPSGAAGRLAGWIMAARPSNRVRNRWTVDLLRIRPDHRVLEIGYGPGTAIGLAAACAHRGIVIGLDRSKTMYESASRRHRKLIEAGRLDLNVGSVEQIGEILGEDANGFFDRIFAVNAVMFWADPGQSMRQLSRLLAPGGRMAFTHQPRLGPQTDAAALESATRMREWLQGAGLVDVRIEVRRDLAPAAVCVIGDKPLR